MIVPGELVREILETLREFYQFRKVPRLERRVARVLYNVKVCLGPRAVEIPSGLCRTHHVVTALDDAAWNVPNSVHVVQDPSLPFEKSAMNEVV
jgi:hypothetical protein